MAGACTAPVNHHQARGQHHLGVVAVQCPQPKPDQDGRVPHPVQHPVQQRPPRAAPELEPGHLPIDPVGDRARVHQQPALTEDMIGGDQHEQRLAQDVPLDCGQRRAVAICPPVGIHDPDLVATEATDNRRDRSGVVADHHQNPLQPSGEQGPHRPLDQAQPPSRSSALEPPLVTDASRSDRPAASTTPIRGSRASGGSGWITSGR